MKSYHLTMGGGLGAIALREHGVPEPGPGEALVRVHAASLNYRELMILLQGRYPLPVRPDVVGLCDGAGVVVALGAGTARVAVGDRVIASIFPHWIDGPFSVDRAAQLGGSLDGMLTEYIALPEAALVGTPAHLSHEEAACLPCAGATAWNALTGLTPLLPGEDVLLLGSGGVSLLALQVAKTAGARVIVTTSSDAKARRLRELGADATIDYVAQPDWSAEVRRLTGGAGARHVIETGGGATLPQSLKAVARGGEIAFVGSLGGTAAAPIDANAVFASAALLRPIAAGSRQHLASVARTIALHRLRPQVDRVFEFAETPAAFAHYAQGGHLGKTVIRVAA